MFPLALTLLALGIALFLIGRRGTASGSHPFCTRCRRNLHMLPPDTPRCPECGADIRAENAITIGLRQSVRPPIILGLFMTAAGAALLVVATILWWPHFDGSPYKPASMLLAELTRPAPPAARELQRRLQNDRLSPADTARLADLVLSLQANPAIRWNPTYGDVLQSAQSARRLPADKWLKYLEQSIQLSARARPRVTLGDPLPIELTCRLKAGSQYAALLPATLAPRVSLTLHNHATPLSLNEQPLDSIPTTLTWSALAYPAPAQWPAEAHAGPTTISLQIALTLTDARGTRATAAQTFTLPVELLATPSVTGSTAGTTEADFLAAMHWRFHAADDATVLLDDTRSLGSLFVAAPPLTAAFRVVLRQDANEWPLARFIVPPDNAATIPLTLPTTSLSPQPHPGPAEILCLPDPSLATATLDIQQVWGTTLHQLITLK